VAARQRELAASLPVSGRKPVTFLNPEESLSDALAPEAIARLRRIKAERDPQGVFRANFSA
jgi:LmbE family N-acetylglucosaminyl deacetylase